MQQMYCISKLETRTNNVDISKLYRNCANVERTSKKNYIKKFQ